MWKALGKLMLGVATGDASMALDALSEEPKAAEPETASAPHAEGDPPCGKADGETRCVGHGVDGVCIMGEAKSGA